MLFDSEENFQMYMKDASKFLPLPKKREHELAVRIRAAIASGDPKLYPKAEIDQLVNANLKWVVKMANKFIGQGVGIKDLVSEGNLGLLHAATVFDPTRDVKFITYAQNWIRKYLNGAIAKYSKIVKLPMNQEYDLYKARKAGEEVNTRTVEIDRPYTSDSDNTVGDMLLRADPNDAIDRDHDRHVVSVLMSVLTEHERLVVLKRYGFNDGEPLSNQEIADETGLTLNEVGKALRAARAKMKKKAKID